MTAHTTPHTPHELVTVAEVAVVALAAGVALYLWTQLLAGAWTV